LQLRDIMDAHGASHSQIGRFYDLANTLDENAMRVIEKIKSMLDPADLMNPGVLGLGARSRGGAGS
jgi:D-lactate dehydrogenase (cytochrome)